jgi:hypothetical protein
MNPMTWHTDALRYATIGVGTFDVVVLEALGFSCFFLCSFAAAVRTLRRGILR